MPPLKIYDKEYDYTSGKEKSKNRCLCHCEHDLIFKYNERNNQLPNYDMEMLSDYESLYEKIN